MKTKSILHNKYYLYITEFFAGMSVMAVEIGASRLLAPYFSSSQIVWTIIIGTIMIAMALGNIWGGRAADKNPNPDVLYMHMIIAAIWIAAIPIVGKYVILAISAVLVLTINNNFLILAAFLSCMIIFVFPLFLLGTVTPSLVKYTVDRLDDSGKIVGTLVAVNTIGSILGTFLPTFVTIPTVGTSATFFVFSGVLLLLGLIYFIQKKTKTAECVISIILFVSCSIIGSSDRLAFWENNLLYEGESVYNYLQVKETDDSVILSTNVLFGVQSIMKKDDGLTGMYYDYALAAPVMSGLATKENAKILVLGMGTGTYAKQCKKYFTKASIEGVEIDQKITDLARTYFQLPADVKVTTYDGRAYLGATKEKYDVIMVDAYQDITIPFQMSSIELFAMVKEHLTPNGIMVVNMNMHTEKKDNINEYLSDTIAAVFDGVYTVNVPGATNRELLAVQNKEVFTTFNQNIAGLNNYELKQLMYTIASNMKTYQKGTDFLTDDKAPVEVLGMQAIDELIQNEIGYYKKRCKEEGINGVLKSIGF
ncbi:MAG: fused MFS/spermidine synthase [Selenomonadaceae bacterium]